MAKNRVTFFLYDLVLAVAAIIFTVSIESGLLIAITGMEPFRLGLTIWMYVGVIILSFGFMHGWVRWGYEWRGEPRED
ncbi:hypothetical protein GCM10011571_21600 [Marinithermofilum abyssi]|uniref:Uncharacterized protein n=1 Tax=Marinithermofilum abyssi TaxID=1571185 RepID=A0A8J2YAT2_9BACL|nr:hypothetical protein [Marinithermofilum abyssi]GGE19355.1 hypothetical protein GCM10011571_21600 [Marinithermofilum abyssi]